MGVLESPGSHRTAHGLPAFEAAPGRCGCLLGYIPKGVERLGDEGREELVSARGNSGWIAEEAMFMSRAIARRDKAPAPSVARWPRATETISAVQHL